MKNLLILSILLFFSACDTIKKAERLYGPNLFQQWKHAHEEDTKELKVYRPSSFDFPLSRGREGLNIHRDGTLVQTLIGASDLPEEVKAKWQLKHKSNLLIRPFEKNRPTQEWEIIEVTKDKLTIKR